jgi:hypothetical protein
MTRQQGWLALSVFVSTLVWGDTSGWEVEQSEEHFVFCQSGACQERSLKHWDEPEVLPVVALPLHEPAALTLIKKRPPAKKRARAKSLRKKSKKPRMICRSVA